MEGQINNNNNKEKVRRITKGAIIGVLVAGIIIGVFIFFGSRSNSSFDLNRDGMLEFFETRTDEVVPGDEPVRATRIRFVDDEGMYIEYENEDGSNRRAFLLLVNPASNTINYEIVAVFSVQSDGSFELIGGTDSLSGRDQEIYQFNRDGGVWERIQ